MHEAFPARRQTRHNHCFGYPPRPPKSTLGPRNAPAHLAAIGRAAPRSTGGRSERGHLTLRRLIKEQGATEVVELTMVLALHIEHLLLGGCARHLGPPATPGCHLRDCAFANNERDPRSAPSARASRERGRQGGQRTRSGRMFSTALMFSGGALSGHSKFPSGVKNLLEGPLRLSNAGHQFRTDHRN